MFDIGWSEFVVIGVVALIAIGPKELPGVLRTVGQWMGKMRRMASEFQGQFQEAMREAEMADLKKQVDDMTSAATELTNYNPMESVQKDIDSIVSGTTSSPSTPAAESTATVSPEAAAQSTPAPVAPDAAIPQPADHALAGEAPQPASKPASGA